MFAVRLALQTGWDERQILAWPWPRLALYMAAAELEPFGGKHEDYRSGEMLALFYNANRSKDAPAMKPADWFSSLREPEPERTPEEETLNQIEMGKLFVTIMGGEVW